jgi:probable O-glycosylation ligase (exosortase A-associated)
VGVRDVVLILVYAVGVPLSFIEPYIGVLLWTWVGYFNPQEFTWGIASKIPIALLVALATLAGLIFTPRKRFPPLKLETILLFMLWLWFCVTTANVYFSPVLNHHWEDSVISLWQVSKILLMVFVAMALVTDSKRIRLWYLVTAGSFAFFALKGTVFGLVTSGEDKVYGPKNSMIYDNNDFGLAMNMALPMFVAFARTEQSRILRWGFWLAVPMGMVAVILTYSRGAMLGLACVLFLLVMKSKHRVLPLLATGAVVLGVLTFAPAQWTERMHTLGNVERDKSAQARFHSWAFAYRLFLDHPITGGGFQTFTAPLYRQYNMLADKVQGPHSIYFQILGEHGLPGLMIFLALIASCMLSCRRLRREFAESPGKEFLASYADMVQLGLFTFLISGTFLGRAYFDLFYQLVATVVVLKVVQQEPDPEPEFTVTEDSAILTLEKENVVS